MDFITQFEQILEQTINYGMYAEANRLLGTYPATGHPYTLKIFSLINRLRQCTLSSPQRIVLFRTGNYILDYISEQFRTTFMENGCETFLFDPADYSASTNALFSFAKNGIDAAYFFNNVGLLQTLEDGRNLWETLFIPCFDFLVDHPMYYADSLDYAPSRTTLLVADQTHIDYIRRFYPRVHNTLFLPTGGCEVPFNTQSWIERKLDILFIGSYKFHADYTEDILDQRIIKHLITHTDHTFEQALELCLTENRPESSKQLSDEALKDVIESHRFLETNLTARYRRAILEELVTSGMSVHVYGNGWEQSGLVSYPNFHLHEPVPFNEGIALMGQCKILLNHMAWFKHGSSERIFNAMAQGALCVTDSSAYLDNILKNDINCSLYSLSDILPVNVHTIADKISLLLSNPVKSSEIAAEGQKIALMHTWKKHLLYVIMN